MKSINLSISSFTFSFPSPAGPNPCPSAIQIRPCTSFLISFPTIPLCMRTHSHTHAHTHPVQPLSPKPCACVPCTRSLTRFSYMKDLLYATRFPPVCQGQQCQIFESSSSHWSPPPLNFIVSLILAAYSLFAYSALYSYDICIWMRQMSPELTSLLT